MIVFDLDGTLIDTRAANELAWRATLGRSPPPDFYERNWMEWASEGAHEEKLRRYPWALERHPPRVLPLMAVALRERSFGSIVLSAISPEGLAVVSRLVLPLRRLDIVPGLDIERKVLHLILLESIRGAGVYVDDSAATCQLVRERTGWQTLFAGDLNACPSAGGRSELSLQEGGDRAS